MTSLAGLTTLVVVLFMSPPTPPDTAPDFNEFFNEPTLSPAEVNFPPTQVGETDRVTITVTNSNGEARIVGDVEIVGPSVFVITESNCIDGETVLAAGESCAVPVEFIPNVPGETFNGDLVVSWELGDGSVAPLRGTSTGQTPGTDPPSTQPPDTVAPTPVSPPPATLPPTSGTEPANGDPPDSVPSDSVPDCPGTLSDDELRRCEDAARDAEVKYTPRREMVVGQESEVGVSVRLSESDPFTTDSPGSDEATVIEPAALTCFVRATLSGTNFEIEQPEKAGDFSQSPLIEWTWDVTPLAAGDHDLDLTITPRIRAAGIVESGTPTTYEAQIEVTAVERSAWQQFSETLRDITTHPLFLLIAPFISLAAAAVWKYGFGRSWPWSRPAPER